VTTEEAYIVLNAVQGIGPVRVRQLLEHYGDPQSILSERPNTLKQLTGIGDKTANALANWQDNFDLDEERRLCERAGVTLVTLESENYPADLREIYDPPLCLYVRGDADRLAQVQDRMLAVVGSRRTSRYGLHAAESLTLGAAQAGWAIVSGLAKGIDTIAHQTALTAGAPTIAVLGGGLGAIYPQENVPLARQICETGVLISEQPMMVRPDRRTFPMRNRIIAGMSRGILVVEAGLNSGSLITARQGLEQGRHIFAVPGRIDTPHAQGCHALIKDGAKLVETIDDILEEFSFATAPAVISANTTRPMPELTDQQRSIIHCLADGMASADDLAQATELPISAVLAELFTLELKRLVRQLPGKRFELLDAQVMTGQ
jgi:DNA processing protein